MKKPINYRAYVDLIGKWAHSDDDDILPEGLELEELGWVINALGKENDALRARIQELEDEHNG